MFRRKKASEKAPNQSTKNTNPIVADYNKGVSIQDLSSKYDKTVAEVTAIVVK